MTACSAALALLFLTVAIVRRDGHYDGASLVLVLFALVIALVGATRRRLPQRDVWAERALPWVLGLLLVFNFVELFRRTPGLYLTPGISLTPFRTGVAMAAALAATHVVPALARIRWLSRARLPLLVAIYLALGAWTIRASPEPQIDVWHFQQRAAELMLNGQNPWAAEYPNIYDHTGFTGQTLISDGRIRSFPYPPFSLMITTLSALAGDVRWVMLLAVAATAVLIEKLYVGQSFSFAVVGSGKPEGLPCVLLPVALLFHARSFLLIEQSWTEPLVALCIAGAMWAIATRRPTAMTTTLAALLSVKQYSLILIPAVWRHGRVSVRTLLSAATMALVISLPFVLWDPRALWHGVVAYQWAQPLRTDALSVPAFWVRTFGWAPWQGLGFAAAILTAAICVLRAPRDGDGSPATMALAGAATSLAFFVFAKQAFFNYYWFASVLLVVAMSVRRANL